MMRAAPGLNDLLLDAELACGFEPFQAVRLLELLANAKPDPHTPWVPVETAMRFRSHVAMAFPPSRLATILPAQHKTLTPTVELTPSAKRIYDRYKPVSVPTLVCPFFGLFGPHGTLPLIYTEKICALDTSRDSKIRNATTRTALRDWLDVFNHRWITLLFLAWQKYRLPVGFLRSTWRLSDSYQPPPDRITQVLYAIVGHGVPALRNRMRLLPPTAAEPSTHYDEPPLAEINDRILLRFAAAFARRRPGAFELQAMLNEYFGVTIEVVMFTGQWLALPETEQTRFVDGENAQLDRNAVAGERIWDPASRFLIRIGPLKYRTTNSETASDSFVSYLPDPTPIRERKAVYLLSQFVQRYVGTELDFEIQLILTAEEVPDCVMQNVPEGNLGLRLGWNTWMKDEYETSMPPLVEDVRFDAVPEVCLGRGVS
jgi:type VI secretion system protein ImpH